MKVVCFGGGAFNYDEINLITELGVKEEIKFITGNDNILANLYRYTEAFVFTSFI